MGILRILLPTPMRRRIRTLEARLELLAIRVDQLEAILEAEFPDPLSKDKLSEAVGNFMTVTIGEAVIQGTLVSVESDFLELKDIRGHPVIIPFQRISSISF
ncbi:hypothetical protein V3851_07050 [Paenibacillus sp. M1]|uniref:DUF2642 domain-containing protein n=1 Tax=Paenibacillus haidiansis TaxID=1574488 RepID=A0ABU7VPD4_9BACL